MGFFVVGIYIELMHDLIQFRRNAKSFNITQSATTACAHRFADLCVLVDNDGRDVIGQSGGDSKTCGTTANNENFAFKSLCCHFASVAFGKVKSISPTCHFAYLGIMVVNSSEIRKRSSHA